MQVDQEQFEHCLVQHFEKRFGNVGFVFTTFRDLIIYERKKPNKYKNSLFVDIAADMGSDNQTINKYYNCTWSKQYLEPWPDALKRQAVATAEQLARQNFTVYCNTKQLMSSSIDAAVTVHELKAERYFVHHYESMYHELYVRV